MMKKRITAFLLCCLIFLSAVAVSVAAEAEQSPSQQAQALMDGILEFQRKQASASTTQEWIDGWLCANAGKSAEWYVLGLSQSGEYDFSAYERALVEYLSKDRTVSASTRQKYALALVASGSTHRYISETLTDSIGAMGVMSVVYGLHLFNNGYVSPAYTVEETVDLLLSLQKEDGGWAVSGMAGGADATAMALQALAPHKEEEDVAGAIEIALAFLSEVQTESGNFISYGVENPESAAQVLVALSSLGMDAAVEEAFIKNGKTLPDVIASYRLPDGSFSHVAGGSYNQNATVQVFYAMVSYLRMQQGKTPLYLLDAADPAGVEPADPKTDTESNSEARPPSETPSPVAFSLKHWILIGILLVGILACVCLFAMGKRNVKNFLALGVAVCVLMAVVALSDIQTPEHYYGDGSLTCEDAVGSVTLSISCATVVGKNDGEHIPSDGWILPPTQVEFGEGDSIFQALVAVSKAYRIPLEHSGTKGMEYVVGISHLYEYDFGDLSGWMFFINGEEASVSCGEYLLRDGDEITWCYTCEMGRDLPQE